MKKLLSAASAALFSVAVIQAADWPQWQGADRTRISKETGLLEQWPSSGPPLVWTAGGLGNGYGSMAVACERVFVQGTRGGNSIVIALNRADGKEVWSKALGRSSDDDRGPGPRGTPTVDGDRLYVLDPDGELEIGQMLRDVIGVELPFSPLCRPDCQGLCPVCGGDRNLGECPGHTEVDPRWAALEQLAGLLDET